MELERTLVLLKPDAIDRGIVGEILTRFERVGANRPCPVASLHPQKWSAGAG